MAVGDLWTGTYSRSGGTSLWGAAVGTIGSVGAIEGVEISIPMTDTVTSVSYTLYAFGTAYQDSLDSPVQLFQASRVLLLNGSEVVGSEGTFLAQTNQSGGNGSVGYFQFNNVAKGEFKLPQLFIINSSNDFGFVEQ